jgi:hypothetical protein
MNSLAWSLVGLGVAVAAACGGSVGADDGIGGGGSGSGGASSGGVGFGGASTGGAGFGGTPFGGAGGHLADAGKDGSASDGWVDPECPDAEPPIPQFECDPFAPDSCGANLGCFPWVNYPTGPCDFEEYGAFCSLAGTLGQGEPCGQEQCAAGLSCWLTGQGTECLELCEPFGLDTCPAGLLCMTTDVEGIGACG